MSDPKQNRKAANAVASRADLLLLFAWWLGVGLFCAVLAALIIGWWS